MIKCGSITRFYYGKTGTYTYSAFFLPVIAFLKLIKVINNLYVMLFNTQKWENSQLPAKKQVMKRFGSIIRDPFT